MTPVPSAEPPVTPLVDQDDDQEMESHENEDDEEEGEEEDEDSDIEEEGADGDDVEEEEEGVIEEGSCGFVPYPSYPSMSRSSGKQSKCLHSPTKFEISISMQGRYWLALLEEQCQETDGGLNGRLSHQQ